MALWIQKHKHENTVYTLQLARCQVPNNVVLSKQREYYRNLILKMEGMEAYPDMTVHQNSTSERFVISVSEKVTSVYVELSLGHSL